MTEERHDGGANPTDAERRIRAAEDRALEAEHALLRERDLVQGLVARLGQARWEGQQLRERAESAEAALAAVQSSLRYRVGAAVVSPGTLARRLRRPSP